MKTNEIVRAWKDADYRDTLTVENRAELPKHPAGVIEFEQPQLEDETLFKGGKYTQGGGCNTAKCTFKGSCK